MDQFNLRIKKAKDKEAKIKIRQEKGKFHKEFINAAKWDSRSLTGGTSSESNHTTDMLEVVDRFDLGTTHDYRHQELLKYLAPFAAEDPEKYLETEYKNTLSKARSKFAPDKINLIEEADFKPGNYGGEYEKLDTIPKAEFVDQGWFLPVYKNNQGDFLYRTKNEPKNWKHSGINDDIGQKASQYLSNQIDQKASENIKAKTKKTVTPDTVRVVKRVLEKAVTSEKFAEWYETLSPERREEMYKEMQNAQMAEKIPREYLTLMKKGKFGKSYRKGDNAGYLESIGYGLPEEQKQKLINKQIERYDGLFKQDPNKFYAYWMRQTPKARGVVLEQLGSVDPKPEYFNTLKQSGTEGIIKKALDYKTLSSMGVKSPTRVQLWLQNGKNLEDAIALADKGRVPAQKNQSRSTKAKKFSGWKKGIKPSLNRDWSFDDGVNYGLNQPKKLSAIGHVPNFNEDQKSSTNKLFHSNQASHGRHWGELNRDSYVANFQKIIKNTGIEPLNFKATREKIIEKNTPPSPIEIESKLASGLGYEAGRVKQTDNFIYNDREKLISPEYINDNRIRGLGTPMSNTEGTLAVSSAIVPPTNTLAFEKYLPNFSKQLDMPITEARPILNPSYKNKNFAAGGAVPKVRSVPNFAPEQKPELGENAKQLDVDINNLPLLLEAAEQFDNTVEKLGQKIKDLSTVFGQGIKNSLDANVNVSGLDQNMEVLKSEITKSIIDQIQNTNNNGGQNSNQGSSTFGTPSEIWKNAPNGSTFGGNK